jgi:magnesium transporter
MIQVHVFRKGEEVRDIPVAELSQVRAEPRTLVWVDLIAPTAEELAAMGEEFQVHELALASCAVGSKQRPRVEEFEGQVLVIAYASKPVAEGEPVDLRELDVIAGQNFLLTFHGGAPIDAETVAGRITARPELARHAAGFLLYVVLDELVDTFFPTLDRIGERIEDLEETVFDATAGDTQSQIFSLRRDLVAIRRVVGPMRDAMVVLLRRDLGLFTREAQRYLQDIYDHMIRIVESVEDYQDLAAGALEASLAVVSNRVGTVARNLGAYAAIFAVVTMISGVYGMNFAHMPELAWRFGYAWALGLMVVSAGALWVYFKRKGWL